MLNQKRIENDFSIKGKKKFYFNFDLNENERDTCFGKHLLMFYFLFFWKAFKVFKVKVFDKKKFKCYFPFNDNDNEMFKYENNKKMRGIFTSRLSKKYFVKTIFVPYSHLCPMCTCYY